MDITRLNFLQALPDIDETIQQCEFIAMDTELSGLMRENCNNLFDLPSDRFANVVEQSKDYFIMQIGISCFTRCSQNVYNSKTYNFYIFPQTNNGVGDINRTMAIQAHAIQFLTEHSFDFNKLFKHGISYLTFEEKKVLTQQLKSKDITEQEIGSNGLPKFVPYNMINACHEWLRKSKDFVEKRSKVSRPHSNDNQLSSNTGGSAKQTKSSISSTDTSEDDVLEFRDCTTVHRQTILKRLFEHQPYFKNLEIEDRQNSEKNLSYLAIRYLDVKTKKEKQRNTFILATGFLQILEMIILNKKPIVGHNFSLDLIKIINQFVEPLTDDYGSYKEVCHSLFPLVYDTKYIAHTLNDIDSLTTTQSRLEDLYTLLKKNPGYPRFQVEHLNEFYEDNKFAHQAGYDAYMSGYCFLVLSQKFLQEKGNKNHKREKQDDDLPSLAGNQYVMSKLGNCIYLPYSFDLKSYNLGGYDESPDRSHVFYIEHPSEWTLDDIFKVFLSEGGVKVGKLNRTSALCALRDPSYKSIVMAKCQNLKTTSSVYKIVPYETYLNYHKSKR